MRRLLTRLTADETADELEKNDMSRNNSPGLNTLKSKVPVAVSALGDTTNVEDITNSNKLLENGDIESERVLTPQDFEWYRVPQRRGQWKAHEEELLLTLHVDHLTRDFVESNFPGRSLQQCQDKWEKLMSGKYFHRSNGIAKAEASTSSSMAKNSTIPHPGGKANTSKAVVGPSSSSIGTDRELSLGNESPARQQKGKPSDSISVLAQRAAFQHLARVLNHALEGRVNIHALPVVKSSVEQKYVDFNSSEIPVFVRKGEPKAFWTKEVLLYPLPEPENVGNVGTQENFTPWPLFTRYCVNIKPSSSEVEQ